MPYILVCPLSCIQDAATSSGARRMLTVINAGTPVTRPREIAEEHHLFLGFNDIAVAMEGMTLPGEEHVRAILDFAHGWDREAPMIIHCFAGISRSTASAYMSALALNPELDEYELAQDLRWRAPSATPNPKLIEIADAVLGRGGRMVDAIREIGRGADAFEGEPFKLPLTRDEI
ncbi:tyrosine phosphatase family protein [Oricola cellulosilytica]|uniref:Protein tyrosine phosphatase n=1 Tax=Oricola cellulosilytica TaxID=1429082 RepID=A0A4R0PAJ1_9HYPH|nr:tyrosine phosphatase family protein [Oricola cellulosilytica]TCD14261.1 protein tyrosine phosphatase [Oricola cellulosilytica]